MNCSHLTVAKGVRWLVLLGQSSFQNVQGVQSDMRYCWVGKIIKFSLYKKFLPSSQKFEAEYRFCLQQRPSLMLYIIDSWGNRPGLLSEKAAHPLHRWAVNNSCRLSFSLFFCYIYERLLRKEQVLIEINCFLVCDFY